MDAIKGKDHPLYKSRMCATWLREQRCPYHAKCMFAHGEAEMTYWNARRAARNRLPAPPQPRMPRTPSPQPPSPPPRGRGRTPSPTPEDDGSEDEEENPAMPRVVYDVISQILDAPTLFEKPPVKRCIPAW
jgi:hypothetical protein